MNEKDFFDRYFELLKNTKESHELDTLHDALILWFGENFLFLDPDVLPERIIEDKHAEGVDAVFIDQTDYKLLFIQARTVESFDNTTSNF